MPEIVLASSSKYRRSLLARLGVRFTCDSPDIDETPLAKESPAQTAVRLARKKAGRVARRHAGAIVIGSDQTMESGGAAFGKPHTRGALADMLRALSGKAFALHTAVCVVGADGDETPILRSYPGTLRTLSPDEIRRYAKAGEGLDCAGGMKVEGLGVALLEDMGGEDPTGILGLPLADVARALDRMGALLPG